MGSLVVTIATATVGAQRADSLRQARTPRIIGVYDARTGDPLPGVEVRDMFSGTYAVTSATGTAPIGFVDFHGHAGLIQLRKLGYAAKQVVVPRADTVSITEVLDPAVELAPVVTNETYRIDRDAGRWEGFEQRCHSHDVTCIRSDALGDKPSANLADFLMRADGPRAEPSSRRTVHSDERERRGGLSSGQAAPAPLPGQPALRRRRHLDQMSNQIC